MYHESFKVNGSEITVHDIMYQHQKKYNLDTHKLLKVKLGENYPRAERNT